ncbi:MAG TPA: aminopeptidase P family protein [Pseudomonadota bacterium]|nr:aminopeptidase P family protein [Pseudomonadota bacterium]
MIVENKSSPRPAVQPAAHDTEAPANLLAFMLKHWQPMEPKFIEPVERVDCFARRREAVSRLFPGELLIIPNRHLQVRANDEFYLFRSSSNFYYLTGCQEPDCVLLMVPDGAGHRPTLFVEPNVGKTDARFFTDRVKGEIWEGASLGVDGSSARYQIPDSRGLDRLQESLQEYLTAHAKFRVLRGDSPRMEGWLPTDHAEQRQRDAQLATALAELRLIKDEHELCELQRVIAATQRGFEDVIRRLKRAKNERELEGVFYTRARMEGNGLGYNTVVASGAHACTLHWRRNNGPIHTDELLLMDAGVEGWALYTADITRVLPTSGSFSDAQREIYSLVFAAQRTAMEEVKPGNDFMDPNRAAMKVLAHGLEKLGILPMPAAEALHKDNQYFRRYSLHNVSHMLGLDVHDCAQARAESYKYGKLRPGMVLTIEPGLYFQIDDETVPAKYRGIGVRIEDNVVVTESGYRNLSAEIPAAPDDVERWIRRIWAES